MLLINILLVILILIELCNLIIKILKLVPEEIPPLDEDIRIKMYS